MSFPELIIFELIASFVFGFTLDFADLLDEHGLRWFSGAALLFGVAEGVAGAAMIFIYPSVTIFIFGLLIYWLIVKKIDYLNHQIGALLILLAVLREAQFISINFLYVFLYVFSYLVLTWIDTLVKKYYRKTKVSVFRHYLPTILLALLTGNVWLVVINIATTAGVYVSDSWFKRFEKGSGSELSRRFGLSISSGPQS